MKISRIDLADYGASETIAHGILRQLPDLAIPVPIEALSLQLGIVEIVPLETDGFEGGLLTDENKAEGIILTNDASPRQRRRFTIGHELGHFLVPWHQPPTSDGFLCSADDLRRGSARDADRVAQMEVEANRFAAEILLPARHFQRDLRQRRGADVGHVTELARRYDTSKEATARRYVELHDETCAAIVSQHGRILRIYRQKSFPFIEPGPGSELPAGTPTARCSLDEGAITEWQEVDAALWLPMQGGEQQPLLYEQVLCQRSGFRLTLLVIDTVEDDDDEAELVESWTPHFRR